MEQKIAKWYQGCGIYISTPEQYERRINGIEEFTSRGYETSIYSELAKCFMGMDYDINKLSDFIGIFNEMDISFSEESKEEIPLLAGLCIYDYIRSVDANKLGVMISLAYERGETPYVQEIYEMSMKIFENRRIEEREVPKDTELKIGVNKKITEEQKTDWSEGVDYVTATLGEYLKYIKIINSNMDLLKHQLRKKNEENNLLWWLVANWSEFYNCSFEKLSGKQAAVTVPLEVMRYVEFMPGPVSIKRIMQKALPEQEIENEYSVKEYIETIGTEILNSWDGKNYDMSSCIGFTPILELMQCRSRFPEKEDIQIAYKLFQEKYDTAFLDRKVSVIGFAYQLYLECELMSVL